MYLEASQKKSRYTFSRHWCVFVEKAIQIYTVNNVLEFYPWVVVHTLGSRSGKNQFPGYRTQLFDCKLALYTTLINEPKNNNHFIIDTNY